MDISAIGNLILGGGGLGAGGIAIYMARANRGKTTAETKKIDQDAAKVEDDRFIARETFWRSEIDNIKKDYDHRIEDLENKVSGLQSLIEGHIPWDWEAMRKLKLNDIEQRDPPTLIWIEEQRSKT